jgi:quercetin dioxygenase-like cupin family protein
MIQINIYENSNEFLEVHEDVRGTIADVFYGTDIHHVAYIKSAPGSIRGNHYHANSTQHILITSGSLEYWYRDKDAEGLGKFIVAIPGDLVTSNANEIHALRIGAHGCEFVAFSSGERGGKDYESDTYRVESIIGE